MFFHRISSIIYLLSTFQTLDVLPIRVRHHRGPNNLIFYHDINVGHSFSTFLQTSHTFRPSLSDYPTRNILILSLTARMIINHIREMHLQFCTLSIYVCSPTHRHAHEETIILSKDFSFTTTVLPYFSYRSIAIGSSLRGAQQGRSTFDPLWSPVSARTACIVA